MKGVCKFYNPIKNFGFIIGEDGQNYFVHKTGIKEGIELNEGDEVTFETEENEKGFKAVNVSK